MVATTATIKAIDASAVHRIQSGQVIVNLCSVAKELVENSLDAGATSVEVRFKNQGLDAIEVQDNGSGIAPHNYASLALKHYTSKLATYDDLETLQTFGFRGEALSSLCALSRFTVTTCLAADVPRGKKLEFETSGRLGPTAVVAAQRGTTVAVENLFWNLPVRRRELERNIKREWTKVISLLNQYACIQTGVKFTVSQQPSKGKKVVLFSTKGNAATRDNIINVFGAKTMSALLALDLTLEMDVTSKSWMGASSTAAGANATGGGNAKEIHVRGYVSRPAHGQGRQTPDRQMFYVNGRPCKLPQFAQLFSEVYRSYNNSQSPFIFADIQLDTHLYDVNVSPDKQTILLHDQGRMLDTLRESLIELFEKQDITVPMSQLTSVQKLNAFEKPISAAQSASLSSSATPAPFNTGSSSGIARTRQTAATPESTDDEAEDEEEEEQLPRRPAAKTNSSILPAQGDQSDLLDDDASEVESSGAIDENTVSSPMPSLSPSPSPSIQQPSHASVENTANLVVYPGPRKRPSHEVATVTVGDATVPKPILPSPKRQRLGASIAGNRSTFTETKQTTRKTKAPIPSFGSRLTQMFSATQPSQADSSDDDGEAEDADEDDRESLQEESLEEEQDEEQGKEIEIRGEVEDEEDAEEDERESSDGDVEERRESDVELDNDHDSPPMEDAGRNLVGEDTIMDAGERGDIIRGEEDDIEGDEENEEDEDDEEMEQDDDGGPLTGSEPQVTDEDRRNHLFLKAGGSKKRHETLRLVQVLKTDEALVEKLATFWHTCLDNDPAREQKSNAKKANANGGDYDDAYVPETGGGIDDTEAVAEAKLALTIAKTDFAKMRVVGQFNLGFILAVREATRGPADEDGADNGGLATNNSNSINMGTGDDELFIIDQHASDEKYNFERLQASTVVQSQRLVQPKRLELTAVEEEIVLENIAALAANGFVVDAELDGSEPVGSRCRLRTLPLSRETTFDLSDLEELIALLGDHNGDGYGDGHNGHHHGHLTALPRPAKVRKMFAMRACRSSIMIGKALSRRQMASVLAHMGEMDKPWNCPHGRPTMRHLCSLGAAWDKNARTWGSDIDNGERGGRRGEGDGQSVSNSDWARFLKKRRRLVKT